MLAYGQRKAGIAKALVVAAVSRVALVKIQSGLEICRLGGGREPRAFGSIRGGGRQTGAFVRIRGGVAVLAGNRRSGDFRRPNVWRWCGLFVVFAQKILARSRSTGGNAYVGVYRVERLLTARQSSLVYAFGAGDCDAFPSDLCFRDGRAFEARVYETLATEFGVLNRACGDVCE